MNTFFQTMIDMGQPRPPPKDVDTTRTSTQAECKHKHIWLTAISPREEGKVVEMERVREEEVSKSRWEEKVNNQNTLNLKQPNSNACFRLTRQDTFHTHVSPPT